ncbi:membrane protein [Sporomusaceae bacterium FL31]|nr:membrane protein [Sporomusaceae bacterium FL31]GCE33743.1 membrane protein [Sporomusaceae bacterium]
MWELIWPVLLVVGANTFYNICAKSTPIDINAFASLSITYFIATILCMIMFFTTGSSPKLSTELAKANWTSVILGISIVALEFGYVSIYRAGWKIGEASLVANIMLACVLLFVGLLLYKEAVSLRQIAGMIICGFGLYLIGKQ